jgi:hypothetical protein
VRLFGGGTRRRASWPVAGRPGVRGFSTEQLRELVDVPSFRASATPGRFFAWGRFRERRCQPGLEPCSRRRLVNKFAAAAVGQAAICGVVSWFSGVDRKKGSRRRLATRRLASRPWDRCRTSAWTGPGGWPRPRPGRLQDRGLGRRGPMRPFRFANLESPDLFWKPPPATAKPDTNVRWPSRRRGQPARSPEGDSGMSDLGYGAGRQWPSLVLLGRRGRLAEAAQELHQQAEQGLVVSLDGGVEQQPGLVA